MEKRQRSGCTGVWGEAEQGRLPEEQEKTRLGRGRTAERSWVRCRTVSAPGPEPWRAGAHTRPCCSPHTLQHPHNPTLPPPDAAAEAVLGLHVLGDPSLTCRIRKMVLHPKYKPAPHLENDLALPKVLPVGGMVVPGPLSPVPLPYCPSPRLTFTLPLPLCSPPSASPHPLTCLFLSL